MNGEDNRLLLYVVQFGFTISVSLVIGQFARAWFMLRFSRRIRILAVGILSFTFSFFFIYSTWWGTPNALFHWGFVHELMIPALLPTLAGIVSGWYVTQERPIKTTDIVLEATKRKAVRLAQMRFVSSLPLREAVQIICSLENGRCAVEIVQCNPDLYKFIVYYRDDIKTSRISGTLHRWNIDETKIEANRTFGSFSNGQREKIKVEMLDVFKSEGDVIVL